MSISLVNTLILVKEYQKRDKTDFNEAWHKCAITVETESDEKSGKRRVSELTRRLKEQNKINNIDEIIKALLYFPQIESLREAEIVVRMLQGKSNLEIANELHVTDKTIKFHKRNIFKKCGFKNTLTMVAYTLKANVLPKGA
jgi:DNA-binding NarL/FixJ family response regulator